MDALTPAELGLLWSRFIALLHVREPVKDGLKHVNFFGSIEQHKKLFLEANSKTKEG